MSTTKHRERINRELKAVGMTKYGLSKRATKELPRLIHHDEHIGGVIYGRMDEGSAMLVATDKRMLFVDKKPMFLTTDELTYDVVSGFRANRIGLFSTATLHTRMGDYAFRYVNEKVLAKFQKFIEKKRIELSYAPNQTEQFQGESSKPETTGVVQQDVVDFIKQHDTGVLSTVDREGIVHGAIVNYTYEPNDKLFVLTKSDTTKARNMRTHGQVAFTIFDAKDLTTLQLSGLASIESDQETRNKIFKQISRPRQTNSGISSAPVAQLDAGAFVAVRITIRDAKLRNYANDDRSRRHT